MSSTHCGWSLYSVPSTPTVMSKWSRPRFSLILSTTAAIPAPHSWAARCDTTPHTWATKKSRRNPEEVCGATNAFATTMKIKVSFVPSRILEPLTKRSPLEIVTLANVTIKEILWQHGEWHTDSAQISTLIVSSTLNKHWTLTREELLKSTSLGHLFDNDTVVAGAVQTQMLQDGPDLQQSQSVTAEGTSTEGLSCLRRRNDCGNRTWCAGLKGNNTDVCLLEPFGITFLSARGTLFQRCLWSWVSQRFDPWTGNLSWSYLWGCCAQFLRGTCHCTFSRICKTQERTTNRIRQQTR